MDALLRSQQMHPLLVRPAGRTYLEVKGLCTPDKGIRVISARRAGTKEPQPYWDNKNEKRV